MTVREKLLEEFEAAILAIYGDEADNEYTEETVISRETLNGIARKVNFYIND